MVAERSVGLWRFILL